MKVTSPAGVSRPPALFWIYPSEFEDQAAYDRKQRALNKNLFTPVGAHRAEAWVQARRCAHVPEDTVLDVYELLVRWYQLLSAAAGELGEGTSVVDVESAMQRFDRAFAAL